jgi:hypothetical protein
MPSDQEVYKKNLERGIEGKSPKTGGPLFDYPEEQQEIAKRAHEKGMDIAAEKKLDEDS